MYIYINIYTYKYIYIYIYIYTYIYTYIYINIYIYIYIYIYAYIYIYIYVCIYMYVYKYMYTQRFLSNQNMTNSFCFLGIDPSTPRVVSTYTHLCTYIHTHVYMYTYTCIHLNIYTYTYIYIHVYIHIYVYSKILLKKVANVDEAITFTFGRLCEPVRVFVVPQHLHLHLHVWHDSFICAISLLHMCDMTHSYACLSYHSILTCIYSQV